MGEYIYYIIYCYNLDRELMCKHGYTVGGRPTDNERVWTQELVFI